MTAVSERPTLIIGSRGSALALAQTNWVKDAILARHPGIEVTIKIIRTSADRDTRTSIRSGSSTGVFVKEIEDALIAGSIDLAVHSMKDLPTRIPERLEIMAVPQREDARDALITRNGSGNLPAGAVIGTGSVRRHSQLLALRPDLRTLDIRGNIDTRLQKLAEGPYDAIVLACAGLNRLGLSGRIGLRFSLEQMLPAPGQGALALEARKGDASIRQWVSHLNHGATAAAAAAERAFLRRIGGGCNSPVAAHAQPEGDGLRIEGLVAALDGTRLIRTSTSAPTENAEAAATALAESVLADGGAEILENAG